MLKNFISQIKLNFIFCKKKSKFISETRVLIKPFLLIFLISFLIINWNFVSWIFNYKTMKQLFSDFFQKSFSPTTLSLKIKESSKKIEYFEKENSIEIPKIGVFAPLVLVEEANDLYSALDRGVVLFPESVLPGENGQTVILGHSAPPNWPKIKYDWVFSRLSNLEKGDEIFLYFNRQKYDFTVERKYFFNKGQEVPENNSLNSNSLILISCWPPGKDLKRIAVQAD